MGLVPTGCECMGINKRSEKDHGVLDALLGTPAFMERHHICISGATKFLASWTQLWPVRGTVS